MATDFNLASIGQPPITMPNVPTVIPASGVATTGLEANVSVGLSQISAGCILSSSGSISIQRYLDAAGTIPQGSPVSTNLLPGVGGSVAIGDGLPFASYNITVAGTPGATVSNFACIGRSVEAYSGSSSLPFAQDLRLAELRLISFYLAQLVNSTESPTVLRQNFLTEMGSPATLGLGTM